MYDIAEELKREFRASAILEKQIASGEFKPQPGLSFGLPTLDLMVWNPERTYNPGLRRGDIVTVGADTGMGKSTVALRFLSGFARSCEAHGWRNARVVISVSEDVDDVPRKMTTALSPTAYGHADFINAEGNLQTFLLRFFARLIQLCKEAEANKAPIREYLPAALIMDYLQLLDSENAFNDMAAVKQTADVMRALAEGQLDQAATIAGLERFSVLAARHLGELPHDFESFRMLVVVLAQLRKEQGSERHFNPDNPKNWEHITDFVKFLDGEPLWTPQVGDRNLRGRDDVAGPKQQLNHSSLILILHKMNPDDQMDDRYAILVEKSRNGSRGTVMLSWGSAVTGGTGVVRDPAATVNIGMHVEGVCSCVSESPEPCEAALYDLDSWVQDSVERFRGVVYPEHLPPGAPVRDAPIVYKVVPHLESQTAGVIYT